jgi:glycerol-3-phosphate dehydrogenase
VADLIVIGGGVTGCAVARDAALRGLDVTLIEREQLGAGTSGRFHGMLQSGARYVTTDAAYASQCMRERRILERTASHARVNTGGMFVQLPDDPPEFADQFAQACEAAEIPARILTPAEVAAREPALVPVVLGYEVPDAVFRPWQLVTALAEDAHAHGATIRTGENVTRIESDARGCALEARARDGRCQEMQGRVVVIAAGPWSRDLAADAGQAAPMELAKGSMLVIPERIVTGVVNRCRPPGSFDILVPFGDVTIFGTTSLDVEDPNGIRVQASEQAALLANARTMAKDLDGGSDLHPTSYAGVRPLAVSAPGFGGAVSRRHVVITGEDSAVLTVVGGSFTTHRAMAEEAVDEACARLGVNIACQTADTALPPPSGQFAWSRNAALQPALVGAGSPG